MPPFSLLTFLIKTKEERGNGDDWSSSESPSATPGKEDSRWLLPAGMGEAAGEGIRETRSRYHYLPGPSVDC